MDRDATGGIERAIARGIENENEIENGIESGTGNGIERGAGRARGRRARGRVAIAALLLGAASVPGPARAMPAPGDAEPSESAVDANTGAARIALPIDLPPGSGGLRPSLALAYSSHFGDGYLGVGWRLHLGEIRCATRWGVPDYADCPQYEYDDELLVGPDAAGHYHTLVESFQRIRPIAAVGGTGWEVTETDGTRFVYGADENSRVRLGGAGSQPVARWLLARIVDVFGNAIEIRYDRGDPGAPYPAEISYAAGARAVEFFYEPRPDPQHDFLGGVERIATRRLREIQVTSHGGLHHRLVLGYSQPGDYTTHRTRLASVQRFGADCPPHPGILAGCSSLPAQELRYTDPGDPAFATADGWQWAEDASWPGAHPRIEERRADVNGDGLPDRIVSYCGIGAWPCAGPGGPPNEVRRAVLLHDGSGWVHDPLWSAALDGLVFDAPALRIRRPLGDGSGDAEVSPVCLAEAVTYPSGVFFHDRWLDGWEQGLDSFAIAVEPDGTQTIGVEPTWQVVDLDGDGRADLVGSSRVGGVRIAGEGPGCTYVPPEERAYVEASARVVFRNTGSGWERDPALEANLPIFGAMEISDDVGSDACLENGWYGKDIVHGEPPEICRQMLRFPVEFVELNGDGRADLLALVPHDPRYLPSEGGDLPEPGQCSYSLDWCHANPTATLAFVQRRGADGAYTFVRAPEFDLRDPATGQLLHHAHIQATNAVNLFWDHERVIGGSIFTWDDGVRLVDLNGDDLTDVVWRDPFAGTGYTHHRGPSQPDGVLLNTGAGWCASAPGSPCADAARFVPPVRLAGSAVPTPYVEIYATIGTPLRDETGDGRPDVYRHPEQGGAGELEIFSPGSSPTWVPDVAERFRDRDGYPSAVDLDGDGAPDRFASTYPYPLWRSQSRLPDLLAELHNGRGGVIEFDYTTAAAQRDEALEAEAAADAAAVEPGFAAPVRLGPFPVVASVAVAGPSRTRKVTRYAYARPTWCPGHRSGFGFRLVRRTRADGSEVDTFHYQSHGRAGRMSSRTVREGGAVVHRVTEEWQLADPASVTGAWPGDARSGRAHVGRLVRRAAAAEYPDAPGGAAVGAVVTQTFSYDDAYGFSFVERIATERPSGRVETVRTPVARDETAWIIGLVGETRDESVDPPLGLSRVAYTYTPFGRVATETRWVEHRDGSTPTPELQVSRTLYDERGNVARREDAAGHATEYCYDGTPGPLDWCRETGGTGSTLVALRDAAGVRSGFAPDPVFGVAVATDPGYRDEPRIRIELDPFGRPAAEFLQPADGDEVQRSFTVYADGAAPPYVERHDYYDPGSPDTIRTVHVADGFGGTWKTIEDVPSEGAGPRRYRCRAAFADPATATARATLALASDALCAGITGETERPAVETRSDALGRVVRTSTPDGVGLAIYGAAAETFPVAPGAFATASLDVVLQRNGKGDLERRAFDGDRVLAVDACSNTASPTLASLEGVSCASPERTLYGYQADGKPEITYDARAVAAAAWGDARHHSRYRYDTLGRVVQIDDPDAGTTFSRYDAAGNLSWTRNARGQVRAFAYDELGRPTQIVPPASEEAVTIGYRAGERQRASESTASYTRTLRRDGFGRLARETLTSDGIQLTARSEYDLLGRPTWIERRHAEGVRYEYAGAFLVRVCAHSTSCLDPQAKPYLEDVAYDGVGRRRAMRLPGGERTFAYGDDAQPEGARHLRRDAFASTGAGGFSVSLDLLSRDELGNVLAWSTATTGGLDATGSYAYDHRNRIASRSLGGAAPESFAYDDLGNLVVHAGVSQLFEHADKPHALTAAGAARYAYDASGNRTGDGERHYRYDSANRLVCVGTHPSWCNRLSVLYDASGRRVRERVPGMARYFLGDGLVFTDRSDGHSEVRVEISAFGERVAYVDYTVSSSALAPPLLDVELPAGPSGALPLLALAGLVGLAALAVRAGVPGAVAARPGAAAVSAVLCLGIGIPHAAIAGGGGYLPTVRWVLSDPLGSGVVELDEDGGLVRQTRFAPFGRVDAEAGFDTGRRHFAGHPEQPETGLLYLRARWLDPATGSFLSVDPIARVGEPERWNGYAYAGSNPVSWVDPLGLEQVPQYPRPNTGYVGRGGSIFILSVGDVFGPDPGMISPAELANLVAGIEADLAGGKPVAGAAAVAGGAVAAGVASGGLGGLVRGLIAILSAVELVIRTAVRLLIGDDYGAAWGDVLFGRWSGGPTGGFLPDAFNSLLLDVHSDLPADAADNGMHAWHAGSNAALAGRLGALGLPFILLGGVLHETPLDLSSFMAENHFQGNVNHLIDSVTDIAANAVGAGIGIAVPRTDLAIDAALYFGNYLPGPGETDPRFGGAGPYTGQPSAAWGH